MIFWGFLEQFGLVNDSWPVNESEDSDTLYRDFPRDLRKILFK
jgi:hypothetical protein